MVNCSICNQHYGLLVVCNMHITKSFLHLFTLQLSSYAIREMEEYKNFCDRTKDQRPLPEEIVGVSHPFKTSIRFSIA